MEQEGDKWETCHLHYQQAALYFKISDMWKEKG
jgi:hypothetical protein